MAIFERFDPKHQRSKAILQCGKEGSVEPIEWIWRYWLAKGKFHILAGAPGSGKTTLALSFGATISAARQWPDGTKPEEGNVLIWSGEDDIADTLKPRLMQMNTDLGRIYFVTTARQSRTNLDRYTYYQRRSRAQLAGARFRVYL